MLAFYSAECGLKSLVMQARGDKTSQGVGKEFGHNLRALIAEAKISVFELGLKPGDVLRIPSVALDKSGADISFSDLHTAWRYGLELESSGETAASDLLDALTSALRSRFTS